MSENDSNKDGKSGSDSKPDITLTGLLNFCKQFWQLIARPLTELAAATVFLSYALGVGTYQGISTFASHVKLVPEVGSLTDRALTLYGIDKIVPVAVAFLLIITAQATAGFFHRFGTAIPGHLRPDSRRILAASNTEEKLRQLLSKYDKIETLEALDGKIDSEIEKNMRSTSSISELKALQIKETQTKSVSDFTKGLGVTAVIVALSVPRLLGNPIPWFRAGVLAVVFFILLLYLTLQRMKLRSEYMRNKVDDYLEWLEIHGQGARMDVKREDHHTLIKASQDEASKKGSWNFEWTHGVVAKKIPDLLRVLGAGFKSRPIRPLPPP
jgi:hypothetical protein